MDTSPPAAGMRSAKKYFLRVGTPESVGVMVIVTPHVSATRRNTSAGLASVECSPVPGNGHRLDDCLPAYYDEHRLRRIGRPSLDERGVSTLVGAKVLFRIWVQSRIDREVGSDAVLGGDTFDTVRNANSGFH
jgi:hypothetical protein